MGWGEPMEAESIVTKSSSRDDFSLVLTLDSIAVFHSPSAINPTSFRRLCHQDNHSFITEQNIRSYLKYRHFPLPAYDGWKTPMHTIIESSHQGQRQPLALSDRSLLSLEAGGSVHGFLVSQLYVGVRPTQNILSFTLGLSRFMLMFYELGSSCLVPNPFCTRPLNDPALAKVKP
ncbi:unnamed protein product [Dovyalis caffra]|uniref:Uncharacterized protein n=1 Tax=Dovyalis caffra TaxID=77055 RepID=A0AAV1S8J5_9ROSI|nr:unnamed protein product [Dovyalis caffra]